MQSPKCLHVVTVSLSKCSPPLYCQLKYHSGNSGTFCGMLGFRCDHSTGQKSWVMPSLIVPMLLLHMVYKACPSIVYISKIMQCYGYLIKNIPRVQRIRQNTYSIFSMPFLFLFSFLFVFVALCSILPYPS